MEYKEIQKLLEIQYLKGRLDELYKGFVPHNNSTRSRIVDSRISKYEDKLKSIDEIAYHLYIVERTNIQFSKRKQDKLMINLLEDTLECLEPVHRKGFKLLPPSELQVRILEQLNNLKN
jgi:vacuolar-type H+-ATPase subunit E/Vma4